MTATNTLRSPRGPKSPTWYNIPGILVAHCNLSVRCTVVRIKASRCEFTDDPRLCERPFQVCFIYPCRMPRCLPPRTPCVVRYSPLTSVHRTRREGLTYLAQNHCCVLVLKLAYADVHATITFCPALIELAVNRLQVGKWTMLVDQLFSIRDFAPDGCQPAYLITEVLFLTMLQVSTPY